MTRPIACSSYCQMILHGQKNRSFSPWCGNSVGAHTVCQVRHAVRPLITDSCRYFRANRFNQGGFRSCVQSINDTPHNWEDLSIPNLSDAVRGCSVRQKRKSCFMSKSFDFDQWQSWAINQWHIDNLLATIAIMTSSSCPNLVEPKISDVYRKLCKLFQAILNVHRPKIGGRYHLVVDALNGLLRCLYHPYASNMTTGRNSTSTSIALPTWALPTAIDLPSDSSSLGSNAKALARLLTSLADPSVSAARRPQDRDRQLLHDARTRARTIAGQHLQYVLAQFCVLQLRGRLQPGVREALNPGLWAIMDAMSVDVRRAANEELGKEARTIFKTVYDDWRKFGGGKEKERAGVDE